MRNENMIEIQNSKCGSITFKYNGKFIHSSYDPIKEAENLIQKNSKLVDKNIIVVYGLGLGYHINVILDKIKNNQFIYVFEYNKELVDLCFGINKDIFFDKKINIVSSNDEKFYIKLSNVLEKVQDIIIHRPSLETIKLTNEDLYNLIDDFSLYKQSSEERNKLNKLGEKNYKYNIERNYKSIDNFIEMYRDSEKIFIITSAGPSLNYDLELLKINRDKFNVITVGSALKTLMNNNIIPDCIVILDGHEVVKKQLEGYENENIPLCFSSRASRWAVELYKGPKFIFNINNNDKFIIDESETVAVSTIDLAVKCGAKKVALLGQDLAYINNKTHSKEFEQIYGVEDKITNKIRTVKSYDGGKVNTAQGYIRFKYKIENLIRRNPNVEFINCSKGAFIEGAKHLDFKDIIK